MKRGSAYLLYLSGKGRSQARIAVIMTATLFACLLCLAGGVSALQVDGQPALSQEYTELLQKGRDLLQSGKAKKAIKQFEKASQAAGAETAEVQLELAAAHYRLSDFQETAKAARRALELTDDLELRGGAYNLLGVALYANKDRTRRDLEEAEEALRQVVEITGGAKASPRYSLATTLVALTKFQEAVAVARRLVADVPTGRPSEQARILVCDYRAFLQQTPTASGSKSSDEEAPTSGDTAVYITGDVQRPVKIRTTQPQFYTEEVRKAARTRGVVILQSIIDKEGCPTNTRVLKGSPEGLSESAVRAVEKWVYQPATLNGEPVAVYFNLTINFASDALPPFADTLVE